MPILHSEEDDSDADTGSEETSSDEEDDGRILKPVFVPRHNRVTIHEKEAKERDDELLAEKKQQLLEERKTQTRIMVAESIRKNQELEDMHVDDANSDAGLPDDIDDIDEELEYEAWKVREIQRLKRDAEEREEMLQEKADLLRRRNMTDEERLAEDIQSGKIVAGARGHGDDQQEQDNNKRKFMQKYYHKGAFYMDDTTLSKAADDVRRKNYASEPTLEDKIDKEKLPKVMQVKNFGKRGRTKYTHLLDQDTTIQDKKRIDKRPDRRVMDSYLNKRSGVGKL